MRLRGRRNTKSATCPPSVRSGANGRPAEKSRASRAQEWGGGPSGRRQLLPKSTHTNSAKNGAEGEVAQKTKSGHKVKCGSTAALCPESSISEGPRDDHGAFILSIWRWAQKMSPAQVAATLGLPLHVVTVFYHSMRSAAMWLECGFVRSGGVGGRMPYCGNQRGICFPPNV